MDLYTGIIMLHVAGTILGVGGATIAEAHINLALRDKQVTPDEGSLLHSTYFIIRIGMALIIISGLAMVWYHYDAGSIGRLLNDKIWFKEFLFLVIIANAVAISNRWVPLWLGAATSFTAWWMGALLGIAGRLPFSFLAYTGIFIITTLTVAGILHLIREYMKKS